MFPKVAHLIHDVGFLGNQVVWVTFSSLPGGLLVVLNVYAPNQAPDRVVLWEELTHTLPNHYN
jgi:hypothetical protein